MAKYTNAIIFESWEDASNEVTAKLKIYGIERVNIVAADGVSLIGKGHPELWKKVVLEPGEELADFEAIDDVSKKVAHVIPFTKATGVLKEAFGYSGTFKEIDDVIYFIREDSLCGEVNEVCSEILEEAIELLDDDTLMEAMEYFIRIARAVGNKNLEHEMTLKMQDIV